jgi:hypothetical protein
MRKRLERRNEWINQSCLPYRITNLERSDGGFSGASESYVGCSSNEKVVVLLFPDDGIINEWRFGIVRPAYVPNADEWLLMLRSCWGHAEVIYNVWGTNGRGSSAAWVAAYWSISYSPMDDDVDVTPRMAVNIQYWCTRTTCQLTGGMTRHYI